MANGSQNQNNVICGSCPPCEKEKPKPDTKKPPNKCCIQLKYIFWGIITVIVLAIGLYISNKCVKILDIRLARQLGI